MSRVLVLGATGLLGRAVLSHLETSGHEVHGAARGIRHAPRSHKVDLRELGQVDDLLARTRPEIVVKVAGGAESSAVELAATHVVTTSNLMAAAGRQPTHPLLFVTGSAAEYGSQDGRLAEESPPAPVSGYGWIKLAETTVARSLARSLDLDLTVVRPFNIVSPDLPSSSALGNLRRQLKEGTGSKRVVRCGRVDVIRDYVTASFVGEAIAELVSEPPGGIVNICSGHGVRLSDLMEAAAQSCGVELETHIAPELAAIPAPDEVVGDPSRLNSLIAARPVTDPFSLAVELMR